MTSSEMTKEQKASAWVLIISNLARSCKGCRRECDNCTVRRARVLASENLKRVQNEAD